ncbi:D-ribitol-5-phosphate cytidylyltransferase-like [Paramacrobiotus metropolitanus]|uniref:D-ribitol-5-phosphate cytidylyltransferase-like n=1 Tax=Paramacrobiotus metropolitanus TaxID=2943436 RepID=UPI002445E6F9|nr:D-ribitol-5-phosphate cytidylyltransferase-like [Paramacrobiotus metropolitanus]
MFEPPVRDVVVILPAAGTGERFSASTESENSSSPKQFVIVGPNSLPLFIHTVNAFSRISWISKVVLLVADNQLEFVQTTIGSAASVESVTKTVVVAGCSTRHRTIRSGVNLVAKMVPRPEVVIVHDVVRPFVEESVCKSVAMAAKSHGAAGVYAPLVSTVVSIDNKGFLADVLPRSQFFASEMPQGFLFANLLLAYTSATEEELETGTECLALVKTYAGCHVKMLPINPNQYYKVTYERDLLAVDAMLKQTPPVLKSSSSSDSFVVDARQATVCNRCNAETDYP